MNTPQNTQQPQFGTLTRRPSAWQWLVDNLLVLILCAAGLAVAGIDGMAMSHLLFWVSVFVALGLCYRLLYIKKMVYYITAEQLIYEHGVFHRTRDYIELYRIVDFREDSRFLQQLFGLKTVRIFSGDRTTPSLDLIGMDVDDILIPEIRIRVAYNKRRNGIYEITNR